MAVMQNGKPVPAVQDGDLVSADNIQELVKLSREGTVILYCEEDIGPFTAGEVCYPTGISSAAGPTLRMTCGDGDTYALDETHLSRHAGGARDAFRFFGSEEALAEHKKQVLAGEVDRLIHMHSLFKRKHSFYSFSPGDLVQIKPGMADRKEPTEGQPCIVIEVHEPKRDETVSFGSHYAGCKYDVLVGFVSRREVSKGEFVHYHLDSRRLMPLEE